MRASMARHDELIEALVAEYSGVMVRPRGEGDSRFAVFARASGAVASACAIQRAFARESWDKPEALRVRLAMHTAKPTGARATITAPTSIAVRVYDPLRTEGRPSFRAYEVQPTGDRGAGLDPV
jgi:hypothetical protein